MKMIETTVLKPHMAPNGIIVQRGETITVDETRHRQLVRKGYVPRPDGDVTNEREPGSRADGLTNASFTARREPIIGNGEQNSQPEAAPAKPKAAKAKPEAAPAAPAQPDQSAEATGES